VNLGEEGLNDGFFASTVVLLGSTILKSPALLVEGREKRVRSLSKAADEKIS
jgi:hypothetical protein